jgi:hypothetical protein
MKKKKRNVGLGLSARNPLNDFTRGVLVSGVVAALAGTPKPKREIARLALQGGLALAGATLAADALQQRRYAAAAVAAAGAALSVHAVECLLPPEA